MSEEQVRGLIIAHASLGEGFAAAVRQIAGTDETALQAISNEGHGPEGLLAAITEAVGDSPVILFTDLPSGSCAFTARKLSLVRPETAVVCGVNMPILLDFVFQRHLQLDVLVDRLVEKGRGGINGACTEDGARADRALSR